MCVLSKSVLGTCKSSTTKYSRIETASKWNLIKNLWGIPNLRRKLTLVNICFTKRIKSNSGWVFYLCNKTTYVIATESLSSLFKGNCTAYHSSMPITVSCTVFMETFATGPGCAWRGTGTWCWWRSTDSSPCTAANDFVKWRTNWYKLVVFSEYFCMVVWTFVSIIEDDVEWAMYGILELQR